MRLPKYLLLSICLIGIASCSPFGTVGRFVNGEGFVGSNGNPSSAEEPTEPSNPNTDSPGAGNSDSSWISNIPSQGQGNPAATGGVSKGTWDNLFDLLSIGRYSNFRLRATNGSDWEAYMYYDYGKILVTGIASGKSPYDSNVYKDYAYLHIRNVANGEVDYDRYDFCNVWMVESESDDIEEFIEDFFEDYGLFQLAYNDFVYDPVSGTYFGSLNKYKHLYARVTINNNLISSIIYLDESGYSYYYYYDQYGQQSVTLPTPGSAI